ncbi:DgyrCDS14690 [Dimorphilus gyrociliatus]|nr:DgyrCDS14690 [Dimorphilus gyrociliatus]
MIENPNNPKDIDGRIDFGVQSFNQPHHPNSKEEDYHNAKIESVFSVKHFHIKEKHTSSTLTNPFFKSCVFEGINGLNPDKLINSTLPALSGRNGCFYCEIEYDFGDDIDLEIYKDNKRVLENTWTNKDVMHSLIVVDLPFPTKKDEGIYECRAKSVKDGLLSIAYGNVQIY